MPNTETDPQTEILVQELEDCEGVAPGGSRSCCFPSVLSLASMSSPQRSAP
jgi:hypothetical protein